jgi:hypothetical protein
MLALPVEIIAVLRAFAHEFSARVWERAIVLLVGAIVTPGQRTVGSALRVMGLQDEPRFQNYHRVLNRAGWASRRLGQILLRLLVAAFVGPEDPVIIGIDETIERRRGAKIAAKGIYRDPVRSSKEFFVKVSGLRWISMQLLAPIPWAGRIWGLPFFTVLAPSERYHQERGSRHKKITDWGRQMIAQLRQWLPDRQLVVVADGSYAVLALLAYCRRLARPVAMITRLRLDAALYDPAPPRASGTRGRPRLKGQRQPTLAERLVGSDTAWQTLSVRWYSGVERTIEVATGTAVWYHPGEPLVPLRWVLIRDPQGRFDPQALLCTDLDLGVQQIVEWFVLRWQVEVTFHEARAHLGVETQRQWSDLAILRTTPALFGLFSLVTLFAHELLHGRPVPVRRAAWYPKAAPTFAETLAFVRQQLWPATISSTSPANDDVVQIPRAFLQRLTDAVAFAA